MIEVNDKYSNLITFDGTVIEQYGANLYGEYRYHIFYIKEAFFHESRRGYLNIGLKTIDANDKYFLRKINPQDKPKVEAFVNGVNSARRSSLDLNNREVMNKHRFLYTFNGDILEEYNTSGRSIHRFHRAYIKASEKIEKRDGSFRLNIQPSFGDSSYLDNIDSNSDSFVNHFHDAVNAPRVNTKLHEIYGTHGWFLTFDGKILERFGTPDHAGASRIHVQNIKSISLEKAKSGQLEIFLTTKHAASVYLQKIDPSHLDVAETFIARVKANLV